MNSTAREKWLGTQIGWERGVAETLDEAKAAFRAAWDAHGEVCFRRKKRTRYAQLEPICS
jgi:hypothetical protein